MKNSKSKVVKMSAQPKGKIGMAEKAVAKKEATPLQQAQVPQGSWGGENVDNKDLMIPKILLMQGLSEAVADGRAQFGDIVNSVTYEKLGGKDKPMEVIPFSTFKTWVVSEQSKGSNKFEYVRTEPMTKDNEDLPLEEQGQDEDGKPVTIRRDRVLNFYVLAASEIASGAAIPYVVSFRRTSYQAGRKIATHFARMSMMKQPPAAKTLKLVCRVEKNDKGTFYIFDVENGRVSTKEELETAYTWYQTVSKGAHKVDESDVVKAPEADVTETEGSDQF